MHSAARRRAPDPAPLRPPAARVRPIRSAALVAAGLLTAVLLTGVGCSRPADEGAASVPATGEGAQVFAMACARCHGPKGAGDGPMAARLGYVPDLRKPLDRALVVDLVKRGRGAMPSHADRLSATQIEAVADHVGHLGAR